MVLIGVAYVFAQYYLFSKFMKNPESKILFKKNTGVENQPAENLTAENPTVEADESEEKKDND